MGRLIYLDNNATTQMAPEVVAEISKAEPLVYGNASSMHTFGREARKLVEDARMNVARLLDCNTSEITFTSGASEANNTVFMIAASIIEKRKGGQSRSIPCKNLLVLAETGNSQYNMGQWASILPRRW